MMTQTASVQCAFDYSDAEDWARKFRAAALLSPVAVACSPTSPDPTARHRLALVPRGHLEEVDPARCGLPAVVFDPAFDLQAWVEWVLDVPAIFRRRSEGLVKYARKRLRLPPGPGRLRCGGDRRLGAAPVLRVHRGALLRLHRGALRRPQPADGILAGPGAVDRLLYDDAALTAALELGRGHDSHAAWRAAMDAAAAGAPGHGGRACAPGPGRGALALAVASLRSEARTAGASGVRALERAGERHALPVGRAVN